MCDSPKRGSSLLIILYALMHIVCDSLGVTQSMIRERFNLSKNDLLSS